MPADPDSNAANVAGAIDFAASNLDKLTGEIGNAGWFDQTDITNPEQQLEYKRAKIESEHEGLRGLWSNVYSTVFGQPSYQEEMNKFSDAERYSSRGDTKFSAESSAQQESGRLQQLRAQLNATVAAETKSEFQRQLEVINQNYGAQIQAADSIENNKTFQSQGFKSQAEANAFAENLKQTAGTIQNDEFDKAWRARMFQLASGQESLEVLKQSAAGDTTGAARATLENQLNIEEYSLDPNDKERLQQFGAIKQQTLANFDAADARHRVFDTAQSNERIWALQEEGKDAELRGEGTDDEARVSALNFSTQQRVRELREQADAESDSTRKSQLMREADAAAGAGKIERDALQKELQRTNTQATALSTNTTHDGGDCSALVTEVTDASRKLNDAAGKLDKMIAGSQKLILLKD